MMQIQNNQLRINYLPISDEKIIFNQAYKQLLPLLIKGPTGCGKTRFVEHMAQELGLPLWTIACNEDTTAADLIGRFILKGSETPWIDGPLTQAVRQGGICYLDEIAEARPEALVVLNSLADHRRKLYIDRTSQVLHASDRFMLVASYNPGYQSMLKDIKESIKQRFVAIRFNFPELEHESEIIRSEVDCSFELAHSLASFAASTRKLSGAGLFEGVSTRMLIHAARMVKQQGNQRGLLAAALIDPITDDLTVRATLLGLIGLIVTDAEGV